MRDRTHLVLLEQLVMLAVFALAAAVCVQVFVRSDQLSRQAADRDRALLEAQNAVETLKGVHGDYAAAAEARGGVWNGALLGWSYTEDWTLADGTAPLAYHLLVTPGESETPLLGTAEVAVYDGEGTLLASLPAAWQEAGDER